ncbi:hypothetical protein SK128_019530, partial [Halocaridina rubra]
MTSPLSSSSSHSSYTTYVDASLQTLLETTEETRARESLFSDTQSAMNDSDLPIIFENTSSSGDEILIFNFDDENITQSGKKDETVSREGRETRTVSASLAIGGDGFIQQPDRAAQLGGNWIVFPLTTSPQISDIGGNTTLSFQMRSLLLQYLNARNITPSSSNRQRPSTPDMSAEESRFPGDNNSILSSAGAMFLSW